MVLLAAAAFLAALTPAQDESLLGPKRVNVKEESFYSAPSAILGGPGQPAPYGEDVTVTAVKGSFSKVTRNDGSVAYIYTSALIASEKFTPEASNEEEMAKLKAHKYASSRFDPETEKKYSEQKGPAIQAAYKEVNALEARSINHDRAALWKLLADFRRGGRLGEFANVK